MMTPSPATAVPETGRDGRIDLIRGLALVMIFINHVPGTRYESFTSRNFGFSDAAEAFVLLAGVSAALAYSRVLSPGKPLWPGLAAPWHRAWVLYLVHIVTTMVVLGLVAGALRFAGVPELMQRDNFQFLLEDPMGVFIGIPLLLHQFGYINILPVYIVLMLAAPFLIMAGLRRPGWLLLGSIALWAYAGLTYTNIPSWPFGYGWFLNPFSWQLIFVTGLLIGLALKGGRRFVPVHRGLIWAAGAYALLGLLVKQVPAVDQAFYILTSGLRDAGVPNLLAGFNKGFAEAPRLLHVLALAYLVSVMPGLKAFSASQWAAPFVLLGRQALPVFAVGTVLSFAGRVVLEYYYPASSLVEDVVILGGVLLLIALAWAKEASRAALGAPRRGAAPAPAAGLASPPPARIATATRA